MARGGRRQGQPGAAYSNRTDLAVNRASQSGTNTAAAGAATPGAHNVSGPPTAPAPAGPGPDDTPNLFDPGRPDLPLQDGLATGPGAGPAQPPNDNEFILRYLPALEKAAALQGAPSQFKSLVLYLQGL